MKKMTVRGRIEILESKVRILEDENQSLHRLNDVLVMRCDRLLERLSRLETIPQHSCGCSAQPKNTSTPKEITVKIPYDIICD